MISTAHIFYIPVLILVGTFIGYYVGRYHQDLEREDRDKKRNRRRQ